MNDKPNDQKMYTEAEVAEMIRRSGINKKLVAVTILGVYDNGENVIQSAYHESGLRVAITEIKAPVDQQLDVKDSEETSNEG